MNAALMRSALAKRRQLRPTRVLVTPRAPTRSGGAWAPSADPPAVYDVYLYQERVPAPAEQQGNWGQRTVVAGWAMQTRPEAVIHGAEATGDRIDAGERGLFDALDVEPIQADDRPEVLGYLVRLRKVG